MSREIQPIIYRLTNQYSRKREKQWNCCIIDNKAKYYCTHRLNTGINNINSRVEQFNKMPHNIKDECGD